MRIFAERSAAQRRDQAAHRGGRHLPNEAAITRLVGAILLEQNDEWAIQRSRYVTLESVAPVRDDPFVRLPAVAVRSVRPKPEIAVITPP
jgi:hypothetical protein